MIQNKAFENCKNIISKNFNICKDNKVLLIFDDNSKLNQILTKGYVEALTNLNIEYESLNFYDYNEDEIKDKIDLMSEKDLVILIQTSSFRVSKYRWRNLLFQKGLKVIEHPHLEKTLESEYETYIKSLTYDLEYYRKVSKYLKKKLSKSNSTKILSSDGSILEFTNSFDDIYENIAYFEDKNNCGTRFPVGEVLTEALDLKDLNGKMLLYAYPDLNHLTQIVNPFKCVVKDGLLISHDGPKEFADVIDMIKTEHPEGKVYIRELGLGLNRFIKRDTRIGDISSYERLEGVHLSLGMKHGIYQKKLWPKYGKKFYQRYHIDVFLDVDRITINDELIFKKEKGYLI